MRGILIKIPNCGIDEKITHQYAQIVPQFADINRQSKAIIAAWEKAIDEGEEITLVINPSKFQATIGGLLSNDFEKAMNSFLNEVAVETAYIQQKWPGNVNNLAALTEEVGELAKAMLEREYEPKKSVGREQIYREAVQVAAVALKIALFGDDSFSKSAPDNELPPSQPSGSSKK